MSPLQRPTVLPLCLAFRGLSSLTRVHHTANPPISFAVRCQQFLQRKLSSTRTDPDSWGSDRKYIRGYENIPELESAPEEVKRVFSLQNANQVEHRKIAIEKVREKFTDRAERQNYQYIVSQIVYRTGNPDQPVYQCNGLLHGIEGIISGISGPSLLLCFKSRDMHNKVFLNWLISQRKKKLGHLKNARFERYLTLSKDLGIPLLESPHAKWNKYKFRKFKIGVEVKEKKRFRR
ncbi:uncharacterized protein [Acropora muricata]|uniref:uncharacterized protein isoform X1 n=1 Tax=Acropora muricata TaxID=159855 RepID=UPI0034E5685F